MKTWLVEFIEHLKEHRKSRCKEQATSRAEIGCPKGIPTRAVIQTSLEKAHHSSLNGEGLRSTALAEADGHLPSGTC